jgi:hypothetical protein
VQVKRSPSPQVHTAACLLSLAHRNKSQVHPLGLHQVQTTLKIHKSTSSRYRGEGSTTPEAAFVRPISRVQVQLFKGTWIFPSPYRFYFSKSSQPYTGRTDKSKWAKSKDLDFSKSPGSRLDGSKSRRPCECKVPIDGDQ